RFAVTKPNQHQNPRLPLDAARFFNDRKPISEHIPRVEDLEPDSDLVHTRQVTLTIRVTNIEHANGNLALHTPTDTTVEVSDDATNPGVLVSLRQTRHSVPHRSRDTLERGHVNAQPKFGELLTPIGIPRSSDLPLIRRVESDAINVLLRARDCPGGGLNIEIRVV